MKYLGICLAVLSAVSIPAHAVNTAYTTDWIANTYGTNAGHVQNASRSLWVDGTKTGVFYTASMWDENGSGIEQYTNGAVTQGIGAHGEAQGDALTMSATDIWAPRQYGRPCPTCSYTSGLVFHYNRSTGALTDYVQVSCDTAERAQDVITGIATWGHVWAASDNNSVCQRVRLYNTAGDAWISDIPVANPGALAFDRNGNILVANESAGTVTQVSQAGTVLSTLTLPTGEVPHALYFDPTTQYLYIGDAGPDQNIKVYDTRTWTLNSTIGVTGGYLDTTTGTKGVISPTRLAKVDGIGKDASHNLYVLVQPWGKNYDNGRTAGDLLFAYDSSLNPLSGYPLQSLNFEAIASPDPAADDTLFFSGDNIYSCAGYPCSSTWQYVANTVDPFTYPSDMRLQTNTTVYAGRGLHFGMIADVQGNRIMLATDQDPDNFEVYHFTPSVSGYVAIPQGWITSVLSMASAHIRKGFDLDDAGGVWASEDRGTCAAICYWPLSGFLTDGTPQWGAVQTFAIPSTIGTLGRIAYIPETDTMILSNITGTDWTSIGTRVEVYRGWKAGNQTNPLVINLTSANPKSMSAAGNYLFVGYVHTVPNVDAFNLTTGTLDNTFINSDSSHVYVGNDVDSMYGIRADMRSNGEYVVTKDDYNGSSIVVYRWTP
ncbi:MAG TPA: hypothetical protein VF783_14255 [Terriglobales bacterium]